MLGALLLLAGCDAYDSALIGPGANKGDGGSERDAGGAAGDDGSPGDGGDADAALGDACVSVSEECNLVDDDCDGEVDEDADEACQGVVVNALTRCVQSRGRAYCLLDECLDGFDSCDGDPLNGCEADYCGCNVCTDADGGADADGGP